MTRSGLYCVFRIVNEERKEIYLAATQASIIDAIAAIRDHRPAQLRDWDFDEITGFESLEFNLTRGAAEAFMGERVARGTQRGYRYILDLPPSKDASGASE